MLSSTCRRSAVTPSGRKLVAPRRMLASLIVLAGGLLSACAGGGESSGGLDVTLAFDPPAVVGETTCTVELRDADGAPLTGARIDIEGNMNHAGMVPVLAVAEEGDPGHYSTPFKFTMGGDWFVILSIELADGSFVEEVFDLPAVPVRYKLSETVRPSRPVKR